jgi:hypothetical protein
MKYVINTRGGAKQVEDHSLPALLAAGYIEITEAQFKAKPYYPEYDRGDMHPIAPAFNAQVPYKSTKTQPSRTSFKTRVV